MERDGGCPYRGPGRLRRIVADGHRLPQGQATEFPIRLSVVFVRVLKIPETAARIASAIERVAVLNVGNVDVETWNHIEGDDLALRLGPARRYAKLLEKHSEDCGIDNGGKALENHGHVEGHAVHLTRL